MDGLSRYYTTEYNEDTRLERTLKGRLERTRMRHLITTHLQPGPGRTLADIGGGTGAYATWAATTGAAVTMADAIETHTRTARSRGVHAITADARRLPWDTASFDAALMAGPLYHLKEDTARKQALAELIRVTRPGAPVLVTALNRWATLIGAAVTVTLPRIEEAARSIASTGSWDGPGWMGQAYYHTPDQFLDEVTTAGLENPTIHGVGGPGTWLGVISDRYMEDPEQPPGGLDAALTAAAIADDHPQLLVLSSMWAVTAHAPAR